MVQLQTVSVGGGEVEVAPPVSYAPPSYLPSLHQLPHSAIYPQPGEVTQASSDNSDPSHHDIAMTPDPRPSNLTSDLCALTFTPFSSINSIPVTHLSCESHIVCGDDLPAEGNTKTFEIIPVKEDNDFVAVDTSYHAVDSSNYLSADSSNYLSGTDSRNYLSGTDSRNYLSGTDSRNYLSVDNSYSCVDNGHPVSSLSSANTLHTDTRTDSVDSLLESRGYSSDGSDIYMNSDYTDTVTSADSATFLLPVKKSDHKNTEEESTESSALLSTFFSNEAFSKDNKKEVTWSGDNVREDREKEGEEEECRSDKHRWDVSVAIPEEDTGAMADKEDDDDSEDRLRAEVEARSSALLEGQSAVENLVNQLAEQHPREVVDIRIEVLEEPVSPSLTECLQLEEESWLQSTDSLHHYKLLKQGRSSTVGNLRVLALSGVRATTMTNLHERSSFLNLTAASVTNLGHACQKALSYVRADMEFGSMMSLGNAFSSSQLPGKQPSDLEEGVKEKKGGEAAVRSGCHFRNMLYMALLVTLLLIAVNTTRNLQSSLNQEGGVGIICLAVLSASFTMGSLLSPLLVQGLGVKCCVVLGLVLQMLYVAANLHPVLWLMLPASLGGGTSLALIWNAMSTYVVLLAKGEAEFKRKSYQRVSDKFFGVFCLIYQSNLVVGNLIASLVLTFAGGDNSGAALLLNSTEANATSANISAPDALSGLSAFREVILGIGWNNTGNMSAISHPFNPLTDNSSDQAFNPLTDTHYHLCGAEYCHHFVLNQESSAVPQHTVYLLFGIFLLLVGAAILIAIFLLEPLLPHVFSHSPSTPWQTVRRQVVSLGRFSMNVKFLLMLPLFFYCSMQFSFVCSEVMMAYVTCPVGVWLVGYTMIGYGVSCSLASYVTQTLVSRVGRGFFLGLVLEKIRVLV